MKCEMNSLVTFDKNKEGNIYIISKKGYYC